MDNIEEQQRWQRFYQHLADALNTPDENYAPVTLATIKQAALSKYGLAQADFGKCVGAHPGATEQRLDPLEDD